MGERNGPGASKGVRFASRCAGDDIERNRRLVELDVLEGEHRREPPGVAERSGHRVGLRTQLRVPDHAGPSHEEAHAIPCARIGWKDPIPLTPSS